MSLENLDLEAASEEPLRCEVMHPVTKEPVQDSNGVEAVIWIMGSESKAYKNAAKRQRSRFAGKADTDDQDKIDETVVAVLSECTVKWQGIEWEGEPLQCTVENAAMIYKRGGFKWLVRQLLATAGDHSRLPLGPPNA